MGNGVTAAPGWFNRPPVATIQVGSFETVEKLREAVSRRNRLIKGWSGTLMNRPGFSLAEPGTLDLYEASVEEAGFPNGCFVHGLFGEIEQVGGMKLPAEAGPQYLLQYPDLLDKPRVMFMEPISGSDGCRWVLRIGQYGVTQSLFDGYALDAGEYLARDQVIVFGHPK